MINQKKWEVVSTWVDEHISLVHGVAAPYRALMASDSEDIRSQAYLAAYEAVVALEKRHDGKAECFQAFFRVVFKRHCIRLTAVGRLVSTEIFDFMPAEKKEEPPEEAEEKIEAAIRRALPWPRQRRTREVCRWILAQPSPVSLADVARQFGLRDDRTARHVLRRAVLLLQSAPPPEPQRIIFLPSPHPQRVRAKKLDTAAVRRLPLPSSGSGGYGGNPAGRSRRERDSPRLARSWPPWPAKERSDYGCVGMAVCSGVPAGGVNGSRLKQIKKPIGGSNEKDLQAHRGPDHRDRHADADPGHDGRLGG